MILIWLSLTIIFWGAVFAPVCKHTTIQVFGHILRHNISVSEFGYSFPLKNVLVPNPTIKVEMKSSAKNILKSVFALRHEEDKCVFPNAFSSWADNSGKRYRNTMMNWYIDTICYLSSAFRIENISFSYAMTENYVFHFIQLNVVFSPCDLDLTKFNSYSRPFFGDYYFNIPLSCISAFLRSNSVVSGCFRRLLRCGGLPLHDSGLTIDGINTGRSGLSRLSSFPSLPTDESGCDGSDNYEHPLHGCIPVWAEWPGFPYALFC